jgi:photosystem II stability/assembly factor-like uncharacterized protein
MTDLKRWIRRIETLEPPESFERRRVFEPAAAPSLVRRLGVVVVAGALAAAAIAFAVVVLRPGPGTQPERQPSPHPVSVGDLGELPALVFIDDEHGWAAGDGVIVATSDGGQTWIRQYDGAANITSLDFVGASDGWAVAPAGSLLRTTDGGQTWSEAGEPDERLLLQEVDFTDPEHGFGLASVRNGEDPGTVVGTVDGGETWTVVRTDVGRSLCVAGSAMYVGAGSRVLRSTDGGSTWDTVLDASEGGWFGAEVQCPDPLAVWVLFTGDHAAGSQAYAGYRSIDGGDAWSPMVVGTLNQNDPALAGAQVGDDIAGPFVAISADEAVFLGQCPACDPQRMSVLVTNDGEVDVDGYVPIAISFADADRGWISAQVAPPDSGTAILTTTDGGKTWSVQ